MSEEERCAEADCLSSDGCEDGDMSCKEGEGEGTRYGRETQLKRGVRMIERACGSHSYYSTNVYCPTNIYDSTICATPPTYATHNKFSIP